MVLALLPARFWRRRASFMAHSLASAPELAKNVFQATSFPRCGFVGTFGGVGAFVGKFVDEFGHFGAMFYVK